VKLPWLKTAAPVILALSSWVMLSGCEAPVLEKYGSGVVSEWPAYGATAGGTHFAQSDQITPDNVKHLEIAWQHRSGDFREGLRGGDTFHTQSSFQNTPIVVEDRLYYCTPFNRVFALQAETGEELWSYDPRTSMDEVVLPNCRGVSSWQSGEKGFCEHRIFVPTFDARLIALDADTGKPCEDFGEGGEVDTSNGLARHKPRDYGITSPPAILGDKLITGSMVLDNQGTHQPGGIVRAYNVRSGALEWVFNPVPPGMPQRNADGTWLNGTTNVWSIIAADEDLNLVYLPTGNTNPDYYGGHRQGEGSDDKNSAGLDYYSSSVVALDGDTGEVAWHYQMVHHDIWDYDTPAQPTLVDLDVDGKTIAALVQVTKMGFTFVLDRATGEPVWPVEERPAPQEGAAPGEYLSPTQPYPTHVPVLTKDRLLPEDAWGVTPYDRGKCESYLEELTYDGRFTPPSVGGSVNYPSNAGGNNWGSPAINPETGVMVVFTNHVPSYIRLDPREECDDAVQPQEGTPFCVSAGFLMSPFGIPCTEPPWGTLDAVDLVSGEHLWSVPMGTSRYLAPFPVWWIKGLPGLAGVMMTDSGLVFAGISNDHTLRAFDVNNGEEIWKTELPTAANAVPMSYQVRPDGRQFVVVAAGGHWGGGAPPGDHLIAFALPETKEN
jgi:quinoprotein glucose dehydrogenase